MARTSKGQERQAEILSTARRLLISDGLDGFVLRRIADQIGITLGNLQHYFATRDDLIEALVRYEFDQDLNALGKPPEATTPAEAETFFLESVQSLLDRWGDDGGNVYMPVGLLSLTDERFASIWEEMYNAFYAAMADHIQGLAPDLSSEQAQTRAILVTALIDGSSFQVFPTTGMTNKQSMKKHFLVEALRIGKA